MMRCCSNVNTISSSCTSGKHRRKWNSID